MADVKLKLNQLSIVDEIIQARKTMTTALRDKDLLRAYVANIAMYIYDVQEQQQGVIDLSTETKRNQIALDILNMIFNDDPNDPIDFS